MTTIEEARETVFERWRVTWGSTTPYALDNEKFSPPASAPRQWARVSVEPRPPDDPTLGGPGFRRFRRRARVVVRLYDSTDAGMKKLDQLTAQAIAVFEGRSFSGLRFVAANFRMSPPEGEWQPVLIEFPFDYHETK